MKTTHNYRADFPILQREVYGKPLIYLDNAATTQKPRQVVEAIVDGYYSTNANVHRGVHFLSQQATELHEESRSAVRKFINARNSHEVIFTRGTTESINLLAHSFGEAFMREGDEVILSVMEHHSNIVPWQLLAARKKTGIKVIPVNSKGELQPDEYEKLFTLGRTKLVSVAHVSNVLGTINPVSEIIRIAHEHQVPVLLDGAQATPHLSVDVQELDVDFYAFSGHKMYGPTGVGVLYGKEEWLDRLPPYQGGGEMIEHVGFDRTTFNTLPFKFEAGTPDYIGTSALAKAIAYITTIGIDNIAVHERELTAYATRRLSAIDGLRIYGQSEQKSSVLSFLLGRIHPFDTGTLLDHLGIAVRTGHHCAQPLMQHLGIEGTVRASFALYNTTEEIDALAEALERIQKMF
ncbi:MAG: cysteine desulfurase [Mediterranea sp.]|jgi:cysteine desulfurase/selenocysteine lyase|nr:cysteine desulfurase [Mediterranea sp.]